MAVGIRTEVLDAWADADSIPGLPALLMEQAYRAHLQGGITVYAGILFDGDASDPGLTALGEGFQEPTGILQRSCFGRVIWFLLSWRTPPPEMPALSRPL